MISNYVSTNAISPRDLVVLLEDIRTALRGNNISTSSASIPSPPVVVENTQTQPPVTSVVVSQPKHLTSVVPINQSIQHDYLAFLEDGKKMVMLKRYLKRKYNLTLEAYRKKWGLPQDYPMSAPGYIEERSRLAKDFGLGRHK
ncbi:MAG: MucR family transcriptional regulator [Acetobacter sp.]|nr:MucR family transcriptional regulator [Acetobacter sp.]